MDAMLERIVRQIDKGTRHHYTDISRAYREFASISSLQLTEPLDCDKEYWQLRGYLLGLDIGSHSVDFNLRVN